jgi:anti-sigma B factor antagonist
LRRKFTIEEVEPNPKVTIMRVTGRLDLKNAQVLLRKCRESLERNRLRLIINLSEVSFVASSGVGALLALTEEFKDAGGEIHLVSPSNAVKSVIGPLNLTQFLTIGESEAEVLQAIGA